MSKICKHTWIRIAVNKKGMEEGSTSHWRGYLNKEGPLLAIKLLKVNGQANDKNIIHASDLNFDSNGLLAWIDYFGDIKISDDIVEITLCDQLE